MSGINNTKMAIFKSAVKVFSKAGYDGATMDDIAVSAGVAKGTLYYHFKSKEDIFKYIIDTGLSMMKGALEESISKEEDIFLKIRSMCKFQLMMVYENKDFFKVVMSQVWGQELRQVQVRDSIESYLKLIEKSLENGMKENVIKDGDSKFMSYTVLGALCSAAIYELINTDDADIDVVTDKFMKYLFKGIQE